MGLVAGIRERTQTTEDGLLVALHGKNRRSNRIFGLTEKFGGSEMVVVELNRSAVV
jgi:hypothetical protein